MSDHLLPWPAGDWDNPKPTDAATPERVDAISALLRLRNVITALADDVMSCRPVDRARWASVADLLLLGERQCRIQAKPVAESGDSGGVRVT